MIHHGNCLDILKTMPDNSVDAIVTDPPYGIAFMGKKWDYDVPSTEIWEECLRVLKPGGHLLAFAGTRTQHRMAVRIEDAGFEIRDMLAWVYGSGFPKSLDVKKAINKQNIDNADTANQWDGWGTALKPALEPITLARKPTDGTIAQNVLKWGVGGVNVDGCRVGDEERTYKGMSKNVPKTGVFRDDNWTPKDIEVTATGRFPANLIHDGSDEVLELFPNSSSSQPSPSVVYGTTKDGRENNTYGKGLYSTTPNRPPIGDSGSAARFFYCAKASKSERGEFNNHPTVKPTKLMRYLCRMITPPNGVVLDPFMGSGSTLVAAIEEGFNPIGIELSEEYIEIAKKRIANIQKTLL